MTLDARHRSSIYTKLVPLLGEDDANALMSEFPSTESDELVTKQFLRAELAERFQQHTAWTLGAIAASTVILGTISALF